MMDNPNYIVPTAPPGTNNNQAASTAFVLANAGGGGSAVAFATISALAATAIPTPPAFVVVTDPLRGGVFAWNGSNLSAAVTADTGKAIYVAPTAAPSGASGAWVRQYSGPWNALWFGFVGDGVVNLISPPVFAQSQFTPARTLYDTTVVSGTDNFQAWINFHDLALYQESVNGPGINLFFPPGSYNYDYSKCGQALFGIRTLKISAYGCTFTNIYNSFVTGNNSFNAHPWPLTGIPLYTPASDKAAYLINQTTPGSLTFTVSTPADTANLSIGEWVMLGSLDIQYFGLPANLGQFEYVQIADINAGAGLVTVNEPIIYQHRTDFPDFSLTGGGTGGLQGRCGKARVWKTTVPGYAFFVTWDIDHTYEGMTVNLPPGFLGPGYYTPLTGRKITTRDWSGVAHSESVTQRVIHKSDHYWTSGEPDKLNAQISWDETVFEFGGGVQSSSNGRMHWYGCDINAGILNGAQYNEFLDCDIGPGSFNLAPVFGLSNGTTFDNCRLSGYLATLHEVIITDVASPVTIDGVNASFANGIITLVKGTIGFTLTQWGVVPGQQLGIQATGPGFAGDLGFGVVIRITEDATNIYIGTDLPYNALPAWATGMLYIFRAGTINFQNCSGSDQCRVATEANNEGLKYYNVKTYTFGGIFTTSGGLGGCAGELVAAKINVINPSPVSSDVFKLVIPTYNSASNFAADAGSGTVIQVNSGLKGKRVITQSMFFGKQGTDSITVGGTAVSVLPTTRVVGDNVQQQASSPGGTVYLTPLIKVHLYFSTGLTREITTSNFYKNGTDPILATTGLLL